MIDADEEAHVQAEHQHRLRKLHKAIEHYYQFVNGRLGGNDCFETYKYVMVLDYGCDTYETVSSMELDALDKVDLLNEGISIIEGGPL